MRTDARHPDFLKLVRSLDEDLANRDGKEHAFYAQFNSIDQVNHVVILYKNNLAVGCGAIKEVEADAMEVKRMYTRPNFRGQGIGANVLSELEKWASELKYERCVLETGKRQPEAIALYKKSGYSIISNYGQYADVSNSVCFEKLLKIKK